MNEVSTPKKGLWEHLINHPGEAYRMQLRSQLMRELARVIKDWGLSQTAAAKKLGTNPTRLNHVLQGHIERFSVDALILLLHKAGKKVVIDLE